MACKDSRNKTMEIYTTVASKGYISNIRCPCFRWVVAMAASGCMQSAMSSLWHSGRTVQLASRWSPCSGPRPERRSSAYSMLHVTSTYGTCWKMTHSLWSLREWVLTGNVTHTQVIIKQISLYLSYMVFFFFFIFSIVRVTDMALFGQSGKQNTYSGVALAHESGKIEMQYFKRSLTVSSTAEEEKLLERMTTEAFWNVLFVRANTSFHNPVFCCSYFL